jgi:hypothetical protein
MIDFELAAQRAFEISFPGVIIKGCLFHFGQTLFKNLMKVGLKQEYADNEQLQTFFKQVFCLAVIPVESIQTECLNLQFQWLNVLAPNNLNIGHLRASRIGNISSAHSSWVHLRCICGITLKTSMNVPTIASKETTIR